MTGEGTVPTKQRGRHGEGGVEMLSRKVWMCVKTGALLCSSPHLTDSSASASPQSQLSSRHMESRSGCQKKKSVNLCCQAILRGRLHGSTSLCYNCVNLSGCVPSSDVI